MCIKKKLYIKEKIKPYSDESFNGESGGVKGRNKKIEVPLVRMIPKHQHG